MVGESWEASEARNLRPRWVLAHIPPSVCCLATESRPHQWAEATGSE